MEYDSTQEAIIQADDDGGWVDTHHNAPIDTAVRSMSLRQGTSVAAADDDDEDDEAQEAANMDSDYEFDAQDEDPVHCCSSFSLIRSAFTECLKVSRC